MRSGAGVASDSHQNFGSRHTERRGRIMQPLVTVGLPVYNGARYLERALDALLRQDFADFEIVVSDNGSTDATPAILARYAAKDARVRVHTFETNQGAAANYNKTFELARGKYFKWAAHDDEYEPAFLRRCVETFEASDASTVLVYPRARFIDSEGTPIANDRDCLQTTDPSPCRRLAHIIRRVNMANAVFGLIRSDVLRQTRLIDKFIASDYVLLVEIALLGKLVEVPEYLFYRRQHAESSREANLTNREVAAWFDPKAGRALLPPRLRLLFEYSRSVLRLRLRTSDRIRCLLAIPRVYYWRRTRVIGGRCKQRLKRLLSTTAS